jgi:hypothetical protein
MPPRKVDGGRTPYLNEDGECDHRVYLRERFAFYTESHKPRKLQPIAAGSYSTYHQFASTRDSRSNESEVETAVRRAMGLFRSLLKDEARLRQVAQNEEAAQRCELQRMSTVAGLEAQREGLWSAGSPSGSSPLFNFSLTGSFAMENTSFFLNSSLASVAAAAPRKASLAAGSRGGFLLIAKEASLRQALSDQMLSDLRAIARAARREGAAIAALQAEEERTAREAQRRARAEKAWREQQLRDGIALTMGEQELSLFDAVVLPEMAERSVIEAKFRDGRHIVVSADSARVFDEATSSTAKLVALETNRRDAVDIEQNHNYIQLKGAMLLIDKLLAAESFRANVVALLEHEEALRQHRQTNLSLLFVQQLQELKAGFYCDVYAGLWRRGMECVCPTHAVFVAFWEDRVRAEIDGEWLGFAERAVAEWLDALRSGDLARLTLLEGRGGSAAPRPFSADVSASETDENRSSQVVSRHSAGGGSRRPWSRPVNSASLAHRMPSGRLDVSSLPPMPQHQTVDRKGEGTV